MNAKNQMNESEKQRYNILSLKCFQVN